MLLSLVCLSCPKMVIFPLLRNVCSLSYFLNWILNFSSFYGHFGIVCLPLHVLYMHSVQPKNHKANYILAVHKLDEITVVECFLV